MNISERQSAMPCLSRRWLGYILLILLLFLPVFAIPFYWLAVKQRIASSPEYILERAGATVFYDYQCDATGQPLVGGTVEEASKGSRTIGGKTFNGDIVSVQGNSSRISDSEMKQVRNLPELKLLWIANTQITDNGLTHFKGLSKLQSLNIASNKITDAGLGNLKGLAQLQLLNLAGTQITDVGVEYLKELHNVHWLGLGNTRVTDVGLKNIEGWTQLRSLELIDPCLANEP